MAAWTVANCNNGGSSYEVHGGVSVAQKTAWFMDHIPSFLISFKRFAAMTMMRIHPQGIHPARILNLGRMLRSGERTLGTHHRS